MGWMTELGLAFRSSTRAVAMVIKVAYTGEWPPESTTSLEACWTVRGRVIKVVREVQLENAGKLQGHLRHNPGAADIRKVVAVSLSIDASTASHEEAEAFALLEDGTAYVPATLLASLQAKSQRLGGLTTGDLIELIGDPEKAPYAQEIEGLSAAAPSGGKELGGVTKMYSGSNAPVDVDESGFADKIANAKIFFTKEPTSAQGDVDDDEWDD